MLNSPVPTGAMYTGCPDTGRFLLGKAKSLMNDLKIFVTAIDYCGLSEPHEKVDWNLCLCGC